jgi:RES domain-containing protein
VLDVDPLAVAWEGIRHSPYPSELLGRPAQPTDGRWQRAEVVSGLYLADEPDTAIAEWYRLLAERGIPPHFRVPFELHVWSIDVTLADLSSPDRLARVGLQWPRPSRRTWCAYQDVGDQLHAEGWAGVVAPSAARPEGRIACLFCDLWPPPGAEPVSRSTVADVPPPPTGMTT